MSKAPQKQILIVDDDVDVLSILRIELEKRGHIVHTAIDIDSTMTLLEKQKFDLAFIDIILDADVTTEKILNYINKEDHQNSCIPVFVMSAHMSQKHESNIKKKCPFVICGIIKPIQLGTIENYLKMVPGFYNEENEETEEMATSDDKVFDLIQTMGQYLSFVDEDEEFEHDHNVFQDDKHVVKGYEEEGQQNAEFDEQSNQLEGEDILYQGKTDKLSEDNEEAYSGKTDHFGIEEESYRGKTDHIGIEEEAYRGKTDHIGIEEESYRGKTDNLTDDHKTTVKGSKEQGSDSTRVKGFKQDEDDFEQRFKGDGLDLGEESTLVKGSKEEQDNSQTRIKGDKQIFNDTNTVIKGEKQVLNETNIMIKGDKQVISDGNYVVKGKESNDQRTGDMQIKHFDSNKFNSNSEKLINGDNEENTFKSGLAELKEKRKANATEEEVEASWSVNGKSKEKAGEKKQEDQVEEINLNQRNDLGQTPLMMAAQQGQSSILDRLLTEGGDPNLLCRQGRNALHYAALSGDPESINVLINAGAKIQHKDSKGNDPLSFAVQSGAVAAVQMLVKAGARLESKINGKTYLIMAAEQNNLEMVKVLLAAGIKIDARDARGQSASDIARKNKSVKIFQFIEAFKKIKDKKSA